MPSLPQDSPAGGLGTGFPLVRARSGCRSDLPCSYVTTYEAAFGRRPPGLSQKLEGRVLDAKLPDQVAMHPLLGIHLGSGYVTNNYSAVASLVSPHFQGQNTLMPVSATLEDFKLYGHPEFQRVLPECVDEPQCMYPPEISLSQLHFEGASTPKASREYGARSGRTSPAQPDIPPRRTEPSDFTETAPRSDLIPTEQPLEVTPVTPCCSATRHGLPALGHPPPFAPLELRVGPQGAGRKDPLGYGTVHKHYLSNTSQLAPVAPAWWSQGPTWVPRSVDGIQTPRPSGFSTNNQPTNLWHIADDPLV